MKTLGFLVSLKTTGLRGNKKVSDILINIDKLNTKNKKLLSDYIIELKTIKQRDKDTTVNSYSEDIYKYL